MTIFKFVGCSYTVGVGLELEKEDTNNYTNIVSCYYGATVKNLAVNGNSNYNIFLQAINELIFSKQDILFVQWSGLNRLWLYPGPDTSLFLPYVARDDYEYKDLKIQKKDLQKLANLYYLLNHDYCNLLTVINYSKILEQLSSNKTRVIFINGLLPWTKDIFDISTANDYAKNLSDYSKEILDFDSRNDTELNKFFMQLNQAINALQSTNWVNMFESFNNLACDIGNDNQHPGPKSHLLYANKIIDYLKNQ